jgi:hypothetical protein
MGRINSSNNQAQNRKQIVMRSQEMERQNEENSKLKISKPDDEHEKEAEEVSKSVTENPGLKRKKFSKPSLDSAVGTMRSVGASEEQIMRYIEKRKEGEMGTNDLQEKLQSTKGSGQELEDETRGEMESKMGADLSGVKIHTDNNAHEMAEGINAKAFTHGQDIYFKQGNYNTNSGEGKQLLAHELTHTVQQRGSEEKIQRYTWQDPNYTYENPLKEILTGSSPGLTEQVINNRKNLPLISLIWPIQENIDMQQTQAGFKAQIKSDYTITLGSDVRVASDPDTDEGWTFTFDPSKKFPNNASLQGITSILGVMKDPVNNQNFIKRVKDGELQHVAELKRLGNTYLKRIESQMTTISAEGTTAQEAATALTGKIQNDTVIAMNIDAYNLDYNASFKEQFDNATYGLHSSDLNLTKVSADKKKAYLTLKHRYSNKTVEDPSSKNTIDPDIQEKEKIGFRETILPAITYFNPSNLKLLESKLVFSDSGKVFKSFTSKDYAKKALDTIAKYGFTELQKIGPFEYLTVNCNFPSAIGGEMTAVSLNPDFLTVGYNKKWHISEALERKNGEPQTRNIFTFKDDLMGMNEAYSAFDIISANKLYKFYYLGSIEKPELSFFTSE